MAQQLRFTPEMLSQALTRKIFRWVDGVMEDILPADIYASAHLGNETDRNRANNWLKEKGYRVESPGEGFVRIFRGTKLVRQTRLVLELTDHKELLDIAEAVQHKNIPPPPWQPRQV
jgi:hypothetical protein